MTDHVRCAVVGCGAIAHWHLDAIERAGVPIVVTAAVDPVARDRAAHRRPHRRARRIASLAAALADGDFDAALIAVPHHLHEAVATEALAAGLHVLLEKPLAPTLDACDRILAAARDAGTVFMVAENAQYWPEILTVRDADRRRRDRRRRHRACRDVLPRARRVLRRRPTVALRPRRRGRRRRHRHRFALAASAAHVARRSRRGRRRARPSASRHGRRVAVPRADCASIRASSPRSTRCSRPARSRTSRCSPSPAPRGELTVEGSGWVKLFDGIELEGHEGRRTGRLPALVRSRARRLRARRAARARRPPRPPSTRSANCGSRSRCTARPKRSSGRRCGDQPALRLRGRARARHRRHVGHRPRDRARVRRRGRARHDHRHPREPPTSTTPTSTPFAYHAVPADRPGEIDAESPRGLERLDVLVNNAGQNLPRRPQRVRPRRVRGDRRDQSVRRVPSRGATRDAARRERARRRRERRSTSARCRRSSASRSCPAYGAAKAAIVQLTKTLAVAWAKHGIRVNAVAPGVVETNMTAPMMPFERTHGAAARPHADGPLRAPEEIAPVVLFLAQPGARVHHRPDARRRRRLLDRGLSAIPPP